MSRLKLQTISAVAMSQSVDFDPRLLRAASSAGGDAHEIYRPLSSTAVLSCILAGCSFLALLNHWPLKAIPFCGMVAGLAALQRIAKYPDQVSGRKAAIIGLTVSAFFLATGTALGVLIPIWEVPKNHTPIAYEQLKPTADAPNVAPPSAVALDGKQVFIKGYMFPTAHEKGITRFVLCRDNGDCCFGGRPPKSDMILVELQEPLDAEFTTHPRQVAGTFRVAGTHDGDVNEDILYRLEADYIR